MARSVAEAARGAGDIACSIQVVARTAQGTTDGVRQSQNAAEDLARAAQTLQALAGRFRVDGAKLKQKRREREP